jgi:hypothetical protein
LEINIMAEIKFGAGSQAYYGDVVTADRPTSTGLSLVNTNVYSLKPQIDNNPDLYPNKSEMLLFKNGQLAFGLINNKLYENGKEVSKEQAQAGSNVNYTGIAGELATLGIRTAVGTQGAPFVRDPAAEKKFAEEFKARARANYESIANQTDKSYDAAKKEALTIINSSNEDIINRFGGVNKEGVTGSGFGINALIDSSIFPEQYQPGTGTGKYAGTGPAQYVRGSGAITEKDIQELAKIHSDTSNPAAAAEAFKKLYNIFQNDASWLRREQAQNAINPPDQFRYPTDANGTPITNAGRIAIGLKPIPGLPIGELGKLPLEVLKSELAKYEIPYDTEGATEGTAQGLEGKTSASLKTYTAKDGLEFTDQQAFATYQASLLAEQRAQAEAEAKAAAAEFEKKFKSENAIISLTALFDKYGLGSLVPKIKELAIAGATEDTITIQLSETPEYKKRFSANEERLKKGLSVLSPSEYIGLEDDYRQIFRAYGLKSFDNDEYVQKIIANDTSVTELTNRVVTAVQRVQNADPMVLSTLRGFYKIQDNDLVAYVLDPDKEFPKLERQITVAEIGTAARVQGLPTSLPVAEQLAAQGVTKAAAQKGYATIADILPAAEKLSDIYSSTLDEYRLGEAEQEVFNTLASAQRKRRALMEREIGTFGGSSGVGRGSLGTQTGGTF